MVIVQGSNNSCVLNSLLEDDYIHKMIVYQRLSGISEVDIDIFCDPERPHMKENIVSVDEENGTQFNLRIQKVAVQILYGRKIKSDDILKISQTNLEEILLDEKNYTEESSPLLLLKRKRSVDSTVDNENDGDEDEDEYSAEEDDDEESCQDTRPIKIMRKGSDSKLSLTKRALSNVSNLSRNSTIFSEENTPSSLLSSNSVLSSLIDPSEVNDSYYDGSSQLEYLEDNFQLIALHIKGNVARMKDDMKKEGTNRYTSSWGEANSELKHSKREILAKIKLQETRIQQKLLRTKERGIQLPRLEELTQRFQLDTFEKRIILLLIGKTVSPIVKALMETLDTSSRVADEDINVAQALQILCHDFNLQISHRKYFYQSSKLLKNAVISLHRSRWHIGSGDLTENKILLDRRILDWVVGLDSEINELVEGSDLYDPSVNLTQVVLPDGYKEKIMSQCSSYDDFQSYRKKVGLANKMNYGNSLVILLCGKSGTGKTMTVNAVAKELGKKVLLVDFNSLLNKKDSSRGGELEVDLKGLFRESMMNNAVLFFDECETVFKSRNHGSDRILNSLLTEMERYEGIVFMATNRPYEIDEAMHRRITMVLEYREPDSSMRKKIWDDLLGITSGTAKWVDSITTDSTKNDTEEHTGLTLVKDVEPSYLASKYQLTGGFIKNALLSSMLIALSRNKHNPVLSQNDLIQGCKMQMRGNLMIQKSFENKASANLPLSKLCVTENIRNILKKIIRYEGSRNKVYGSWSILPDSNSNGFTSLQQHACITFLAGNRGSGKTTLVQCVAYELGEKSIKWLHIGDISNQNILEATEIIKMIVRDASIMDAVIAIDGFEQLLDETSDLGGSSKLHLILSRVMDILYSFHGCVFLLAHIENPQNINLQRDFASRLFGFVRLTLPPHEVRTNLWKTLMPPNAPLADDIDYSSLGRKFELFPGSIQSAIAHACGEAAARKDEKNNKITIRDLNLAGEYEVGKFKGGNFDMISKLFT